jgi:hypothetical protein
VPASPRVTAPRAGPARHALKETPLHIRTLLASREISRVPRVPRTNECYRPAAKPAWFSQLSLGAGLWGSAVSSHGLPPGCVWDAA